MHAALVKWLAHSQRQALKVTVGVVAGLVLLPLSPAQAAPSSSTHPLPWSSIAGVTRLCGPDPGYGCTAGGYAGQSTGWWGAKYGAAYSSRNSYGYHNCTLYVAYRLAMNGLPDPGWSDNAINWDTTAAAHGIPVDQTAAVGAAAQWNGSTGHVSYVDVVTSTFIEVTADNFGANYTERWRIARNSPAWPDNFIHFRDLSGPNSFPTDGTALAVGAERNGDLYVFWRGSNGGLVQSWFSGGRWWGPVDLGMGPLGSAPTVAVQASGEIDVFWRGANGGLWEAFYANGRWLGPLDLGVGPLTSAPAATAWGTEVDVYWRGADGSLREFYWANQSWHGPITLGMGPLGSGPAAAANASGAQSVYWQGADGGLWQALYANRVWTGPSRIDVGVIGTAPTVNVRPSGERDVFWRGTDGKLKEAYWLGNWYGPLNFAPSGLASAPSAVTRGSEVDVFWFDVNGTIQRAWYGDGRWSGPTPVASGPASAAG